MAGQSREEVDLDTLRTRVRQLDVRGRFTYPEAGHPSLRRSAVLVPLVMRSGGPHVLLTQRSPEMRRQAGQVAFPGGTKDPSDPDELDTALREAQEEVGLPRDSVEVLAMLPPLFVRPNFSVMGYVGVIPPDFVPRRCQQEVALVFEVPLRNFLGKDVQRLMFTGLDMEMAYPKYVFTLPEGGQTVDVWGATAQYCVLVAEVVYNAVGRFGGPLTREVNGLDDFIGQFHKVYRALCEFMVQTGSHL